MSTASSNRFSVSVILPPPAQAITTQTFVSPAAGQQSIFWGQTFKKGDVPAGFYVIADQTAFSALPISSWSDGSLRFALCAAEPVMQANVPLVITLSRTTTEPGGSNVTSASLVAANPNVSLTLSGVVTASGTSTMPDTTLTLASILGQTATHGADPSTHTPGLYDEWLSPTLSVFRYRGHFPDRHVRVYWDVYLFASGRMNVETVVEVSPWWNVTGPTDAAKPGQRNFHVTLALNSSTRYTTVGGNKLKQPHHTRWSRADWYASAQPVIVPTYNITYLKETLLVPNYEQGTMSETRWSVYAWNTASEADAPPPLAQGNWPDTMASGGEDEDFIGELLACSAAYLASGDLRGYYSTMAHARTAGRYGFHHRDELTGRPARPLDYPKWCPSETLNPAYYYGAPGATYYTPDPTGDDLGSICAYYGFSSQYALEYDWLHGPTSGYLAALLTGRFTFIDECQFHYTYAIFGSSESTRSGTRIEVGSGYEGRFPGHQLKAIAQAMAVTPDRDSAMLATMKTSLENSIDTFYGRITSGPFAGNQLGILCYGFNLNYGPDYNWISNIHLSYFAWGMIISEALDLPISATHHTRLRAVAEQAIKPSLGRAQASGQGYNYRRRIVYGDKVGTGATDSGGPTTYFSSWGEVYRESLQVNAGTTTDSISDAPGQEFTMGWTDNTPVNQGTPPYAPMGFCVCRDIQDLPMLARAVDLGHTGARAAYNVVRGASTFTRLASDFQTFSRRFLVKPVTP